MVFLPLSFFTSYFGMNLQGITNTDKGEGYFWEVCGVAGFLIVILTSCWAFRRELLDRMFRQ